MFSSRGRTGINKGENTGDDYNLKNPKPQANYGVSRYHEVCHMMKLGSLETCEYRDLSR